jgi:hypothetical protein
MFRGKKEVSLSCVKAMGGGVKLCILIPFLKLLRLLNFVFWCKFIMRWIWVLEYWSCWCSSYALGRTCLVARFAERLDSSLRNMTAKTNDATTARLTFHLTQRGYWDSGAGQYSTAQARQVLPQLQLYFEKNTRIYVTNISHVLRRSRKLCLEYKHAQVDTGLPLFCSALIFTKTTDNKNVMMLHEILAIQIVCR